MRSQRQRRRLKNLYALTIVLLVAWLVGLPAPARVQAGQDEPLHLTESPGGVRIEWHGAVRHAGQGFQPDAPSIPGWPLVEIGGAQLPARLVALRLSDDAPATPHFVQLESVPFLGTLLAANTPIPQTIAGEQRPALRRSSPITLPGSPVVVLRAGRLRGVPIVVLAISPVFAERGATRAATTVKVTIPNAALLTEDVAQAPLAGAPLSSTSEPTNPLAAQPTVTIRVTQSGIQRVSGAALAAAGIDLSALDPSRIHLRRAGTEVTIEMRAGADGKLDPADELRFYAPPPGDRWNAADTYWLTIEAAPGQPMAVRSAMPGTAPARATAIDRGVWRHNMLYDSLLPGADGDHWFAADLKAGPGQAPVTLTATLTPTLPLATGTTTLTITGSAYTPGAHMLEVRLGASGKLTTWSDASDWTRTITFTNSAANVTLALIPGAAPDGVEPESIAWERSVILDAGGRGAAFAGVAGMWRYQLANTPADRTLYDVTDRTAPVLLNIPPGANIQFQDGPAPRTYLLSGPGTLFTPQAQTHAPVALAAPLDADVLIIAPAAFHAALAPLVARRQAQGHTVALVEPQAIYDAWSFGQVSPAAIRSFLRYAAATWQRKPAAVTLVGDGTSDPLNYTGHSNTNFIPPYLAMVDPWIGETACETCYAQLDGDDPLSDPLPDLLIGRLPVKSAAELQALVSKIVGYETTSGGLDWRSRAVFVADNYRDAQNGVDGAGDFAAFADQSAALQPPNVEIRRLYYDPSPTHIGIAWREPGAIQAHLRTIGLLNDGAGVVNYIGHSHQWQWAVTDPAVSPSYLLGLYDADDLTNDGRLPIVLEMTCLTSAFQTPAYSGTTIDERLLLARGGAAAVWGPTGLGVVHGHAALQQGFYTALWSAPPMSASLGRLTANGYLELFAHGGCCQDAIRTYALLGDPLTPARTQPAQRVYMPLLRR